MEQPPSQESLELQEIINKFRELRNRYENEIDPKDYETRDIAEQILKEIEETAIEALVKTKGQAPIMEALNTEFISPLTSGKDANSFESGVFRNMTANIASEAAQRLSQEK